MRVTASWRLAGASLPCRTPRSASCKSAKSLALTTTIWRLSAWIWALRGVQLGLLVLCSSSPLGRLNSRRSCSEPSLSISPLVARGCWISSARATLSRSTRGGGVSAWVGASGASATARTLINTLAIVAALELLLCSVATACHWKLSCPSRSPGGMNSRPSRSSGWIR